MKALANAYTDGILKAPLLRTRIWRTVVLLLWSFFALLTIVVTSIMTGLGMMNVWTILFSVILLWTFLGFFAFWLAVYVQRETGNW